MHEFAPVVVSLAVIAGGIVVEWYIERLEPLLSVSQLTKTLVLGVALGGPFVLEDLGLLPAPDGWGLVAALALVLVLYVPATRLVGVPGGIGSSGDGASC